MKGFIGAFFVFLMWSFGSVYYLHLKEDSLATNDNNKEEISTEATPAIPISNTPTFEKKNTSIDVNSGDVEDNEMDTVLTNEVEVIDNSIDPDVDLVANNAKSNAQLLANEIKKTIAISDTIDFDIDEPEQSLSDVLKGTTQPSVSSKLFYPRYSNTDLVLDKKLVAYADELKMLLASNPDKKITIIGHTDNVGNDIDNFKIALKKARQIKWYLTARRGIPRSKVTATSRGEEEPIETNDSKWGRKKNNRIEIIID